jgi:hypothetical protein
MRRCGRAAHGRSVRKCEDLNPIRCPNRDARAETRITSQTLERDLQIKLNFTWRS